MRTILAWIIYGIIPDSTAFVGRLSDYENPVEKSRFWTIITALVFPAWFALLVFASVWWTEKVDPYFIKFAQWAESVMVGKQELVSQATLNQIKANGGYEFRFGNVNISLGKGEQDMVFVKSEAQA